MSRNLVVWGAGGHAKVVLEAAQAMGWFESIVLIDDDPAKIGQDFCAWRVVGGPEELHRLAGNLFIIAVGDNTKRSQCFDRACEQGLQPSRVVHPSAAISPSADIGLGTAILPGAIVNAAATIGADCIINSGAIVEHDCVIAEHVHIAPRAVLGGSVVVGRFSLIGLGATLLPRCIVGDHAVIGAGSVVLKEAPSHKTMCGVPAKIVPFR